MKPSEIYFEAARRIAEGDSLYCCGAIRRAQTGSGLYGKHVSAFGRIFKPRDKLACESWFGCFYKNQNARVLALLFMHEIAKSEEA